MDREAGGDGVFHEGELAVQRRAGVRGHADRLAGMLAPPDLDGGVGRFLGERRFAVLATHDRAGRLWASPLAGPPGFLDPVDAATLVVHAAPGPADPLHDLAPGGPAGMLAVDFARRRRIRVNGTLAAVDRAGLTVIVDQAYGNCPRYIRQRRLEPALPADRRAAVGRCADVGTARDELADDDAALIARAETVFFGTAHPHRGADASHRGGPAGFVRVHDPRTVWWPDYPGNNMFNSLGNLAADPGAALLVVDFATGATLPLSGRARVDWSVLGLAGDDAGTGRRVWFDLDTVVSGPSLPLRGAEVGAVSPA